MWTFIHLFSYPHFSRGYREDIEKIAPQKTVNFFRKKAENHPKCEVTRLHYYIKKMSRLVSGYILA